MPPRSRCPNMGPDALPPLPPGGASGPNYVLGHFLRRGTKFPSLHYLETATLVGGPTATEHVMVRKILESSLIAGALLALAACNTVAGAGKDVSSAGQAVTNAAH